MPKDPIMLLSFVNTQLRDNYSSLSELCAAYCADKADIVDKLGKINYVYDKEANKFV